MYEPDPPPEGTQELLGQFLSQELQKIAEALQSMQFNFAVFVRQYAEQSLVEEGKVVFADGTFFDPNANGTGYGLQLRRNGKWRLLFDRFCKFNATANPGTGDDSADGFEVGSIWINLTADSVYMCTDASVGSAVWKQLG